MPPKASSSSKTTKPQAPTKEALEAINTYLSQKPDFEKLIKEAKENPWRAPNSKTGTEYDTKIKEAVRKVLEERQKEAEAKALKVSMPVHPKEEEAGSSKRRPSSSRYCASAELTFMENRLDGSGRKGIPRFSSIGSSTPYKGSSNSRRP